MNIVFKGLAVIAACLSLVAPAVAQSASPEGAWETGPKDLRYQLQYCNGDQLCGILTYALDQSPKMQRYVNTMVLKGARRVGPQSWQGSLVLAGYRMSGTMTLNGDRLEVDACVALIICGDFTLYRVK